MKHLLNTLYILSEDIYLSLDGENVVANRDKQAIARYPLHTLQNIITFSYAGASPALMGACAQRQVGLAFCTPRGKFLARACGEGNGNVLLRRTQYRIADDPGQCCQISRTMIFGKLFNARWSIERTRRDHGLRVDSEKLASASKQIYGLLAQAKAAAAPEELRGLEGGGLDSYVGFLHRDRPGRTSLALDLMEELRPCMADRFVLTLINNRQVKAADFQYMESGAVLLTDSGRKTFLKHWQEKKKEALTHPYLGEKLPWGMIPYIQALLLARYLRGDLDAYPPFLWK